MTGPYLVRHLPACTCDGIHADANCPRWADDRGVVSVKAFETLGRLRSTVKFGLLPGVTDLRVRAELSARLAELPAEGGKVELPDGSEIVVEETTWTALWRETGKPWLTFHSASPAAVVRIFNEWAAERYGTEAR